MDDVHADVLTAVPPLLSAQKDWPQVRGHLQEMVSSDEFNNWFRSVEFHSITGNTAVLTVPTEFLKSWLGGPSYRIKLVEAWRCVNPLILYVHIRVRSATRAKAYEEPADVARSPVVTPTTPKVEVAKPIYHPPKVFAGSPLETHHTFGAFMEDTSNRVALAAARTIAEGGEPTTSPLFIHSPNGRGKTHLLQAIVHAARAANPEDRVVYLTAEHFMFRFRSMMRDQATLTSTEVIDILLVDDVQLLRGKTVAKEFWSIITALVEDGRQIVLTADRPSAKLENLDERTRSRLSSETILEIGAQDLDLRRRILLGRLAVERETRPGLNIPNDVIDYIAEQVTTSGHDLGGAFNRLLAQWIFTHTPVTVESAKITLKDLIGSKEPRRLRIDDIQKVVGRHFNVSRAEILSSKRTRTIVRPRQIAMYLVKRLTRKSLPEIGRHFGGRDHTTALHAVRRVEELMESDSNFRDEVKLLQEMVEKSPTPAI